MLPIANRGRGGRSCLFACVLEQSAWFPIGVDPTHPGTPSTAGVCFSSSPGSPALPHPQAHLAAPSLCLELSLLMVRPGGCLSVRFPRNRRLLSLLLGKSSVLTKSKTSGTKLLGFQSWLCSFAARRPWASQGASACPSVKWVWQQHTYLGVAVGLRR